MGILKYSLFTLLFGSIVWPFIYLFFGKIFYWMGLSEIVVSSLPVAIVTFLCVAVGGILWHDDETNENEKITASLRCSVEEKEKAILEYIARQKELEDKVQSLERTVKEQQLEVKGIINEQKQTFPYLAQQFADAEYLSDLVTVRYLQSKKRPALSAAEEVKKIAAEKRTLKKEYKMLQYQLTFLKGIFPWLESYSELKPLEAAEYMSNSDDDYDKVRKWMSPEEYAHLPSAEKNQLALDRWKKRKKSDWEAGRDYERYIGYLYEKDGYSVEFVGALNGKEDRGIDLIAKKGHDIEIIQCKRYSATMSKFVRENTVAQIFGVTAVYKMENPTKNAHAVIYTSSTLSAEAKHFAEYLNIRVIENKPLPESYPMIKCNVSKDGEKIYHLPFDQQYDKIHVAGKKGAMYVETTALAEEYGFRRAKRWIPEE